LPKTPTETVKFSFYDSTVRLIRAKTFKIGAWVIAIRPSPATLLDRNVARLSPSRRILAVADCRIKHLDCPLKTERYLQIASVLGPRQRRAVSKTLFLQSLRRSTDFDSHPDGVWTFWIKYERLFRRYRVFTEYSISRNHQNAVLFWWVAKNTTDKS